MTVTDQAYRERNQLAVLLARMALAQGWKAGRHWDRDAEVGWENVVMIDLPTGQVSWHVNVMDCVACGFQTLPKYAGRWDGHTKQQTWDNVFTLILRFEYAVGDSRGVQ